MKFCIKILLSLFVLISCSVNSNLSQNSDTVIIEKHLRNITKTSDYRNYQNLNTLNSVADYIYNVFSGFCDTVYFQQYLVGDTEYKNVIGVISPAIEERVVIGAHYDVAGEQEGADDNASGIVGLLELARLLKNQNTDYRIDLVAYTLEEPPFFRSKSMGSYIHAKSLFDSQVKLKGMICLEMIGYFSDKAGSQDYPLPHKKIIYGNEGNFILIVQKFNNGQFGNEVKNLMKSANLVETKSIKAPSSIPGIDFSDHLNYWDFGYNAVMITNTAFYRNKNYHQKSDTMETLDLERMSEVINEVYYAVINLK